MRKDLIPLFLSQARNKKLIYNVLTIMVHLTSSLEDHRKREDYEELVGYLEGYKEQMSISDFSEVLISVLGDVVKVENKTKYHNNMIEVGWGYSAHHDPREEYAQDKDLFCKRDGDLQR